VEGDVTILEAGTGDSPNPRSDDDDEICELRHNLKDFVSYSYIVSMFFIWVIQEHIHIPSALISKPMTTA
jgi:hypothetical protein